MNTYYNMPKKKHNALVILVTLLIGLGGLYYCFAMNDSTGTEANQWSFYSADYDIICDDSGVFEPAKVEWKTGSDVHDLDVSMTSDYTAAATTVTATVTVSGYLWTNGDYTGTIVVSNADGTHTEELAFTSVISEDNTTFGIIVISILFLGVSAYLAFSKKS